jgi:hypothetical protein
VWNVDEWVFESDLVGFLKAWPDALDVFYDE